jgi:predicted XRE-type DNA-binding protein
VKSAANKSRHVTRGNVLDDLGFSPEQAAALKFKAQLYQAILKYSEKYSQKELQAILGEPQPRVSELLNGKIANKSIDKLLYYAGRLGIETRAKFVQVHKEVVEKELATAKIEEGYAAAQRGELIDADEVRLRMAARKRDLASR